MIPEFYTKRPEWDGQIERIVERVGRVSALEDVAKDRVELRRANRIRSVHSSTAIEGNRLSLAQVERVANGAAVVAPPRDVKEVENALAAYGALDTLDPWDTDDFLRAHHRLTEGLVAESGAFRTVDVEIVNAEGEVLHTGSRAEKVPRLVSELLEWGAASSDHALVVSSATHFLIEHIHPFRDGNGRIGRLWQTLVLSRWKPIFAWMPVETLIRQHQSGYYLALQASREPEIDAAVFVNYMLDVIEQSLVGYEARARANATDVGANVGANVGVNGPDAVLRLLRERPGLTAVPLAAALGKSPRTVERYLRALKSAGRIRRIGSAKTGHWEVIKDGEPNGHPA
ncbi:MAG: Fic family protein [Bifidobacteriaceae bacterium]|jgi:Fic family protein|nr:Fic family protein [Bifidobacteriaceae bacterium]